MEEKVLEVNDRIEIEISHRTYQGIYPSKIQDISDNILQVIPPYDKGELVPVREGTKLKIFFTRADSAYKFLSQVVGRVTEPFPILHISGPEEIVRVQRRNFFRLDLNAKVKYRFLDESGQPCGDFKKSVTSDISAGGIKLLLNEKMYIDNRLELYINISPVRDIPLEGKVVKIYKMTDRKKDAAGIEFVNINSKLRDEIISWMFDYQRELRKKGLL